MEKLDDYAYLIETSRQLRGLINPDILFVREIIEQLDLFISNEPEGYHKHSATRKSNDLRFLYEKTTGEKYMPLPLVGTD